jgi:hypothetical protein
MSFRVRSGASRPTRLRRGTGKRCHFLAFDAGR